MRITRLYLRNYRVFADELELEVPAGLVGIYGVNGSGKSSLVESIRWSLWGKARTAKDEIRTTGVNTDCVTEVQFEHESHLYLVRRSLAGTNSTQKAEVHWNGAQVAEGVTDVRRYLESVLGMDDQSFRASVFAEQKQVSAFSDVTADKRRELVLRLLGITPLDKARDLARADGRDHKKVYDALHTKLPDLDELRARLAAAEDAATAAGAAVEASTKAAAAAVAARVEADAAFEQADEVRRRYDELVNEGKATVARLQEATSHREGLAREREELAVASARVVELRPLADGLGAVEQRLDHVRAVVAADEVLAALAASPGPAEVPPPDEAAIDALRVAAEAASSAAADLAGELRAATADLRRAEDAASRSAELSGAADCPVCGQALGDAFEQVQAHRRAEVEAAAARVGALTAQHQAATAAQAAAKRDAAAAVAALAQARAAWDAWQEHAARRAAAEAARAEALARVVSVPPGGPPGEGELARLVDAVAVGKRAAVELERLTGRLERAGAVESSLTALAARIDALTAEADELRARVKHLAFDKDALDRARAARDEARIRADALARQAEDGRVAAAAAGAALDAAKERLADGEARHAEIAAMADEVRHASRTADLLSEFRNTVVQSVGPQLATHAAELFAELTDHEYDTLDVDPETYEIRITDAGVAHGLARFSGSETDLANLALRIAISEHVRLQSGGQVGLLVLDEVFGPLDDDRKDRMLLALERLRARFRQVLVITHDGSIKEQIPNAIEVVKRPGRRATARVI